MNTLDRSPLSITRPASAVGVPVVPLANSMRLSLTTELVVFTVVVVPVIVRSPRMVVEQVEPAALVPIVMDVVDPVAPLVQIGRAHV